MKIIASTTLGFTGAAAGVLTILEYVLGPKAEEESKKELKEEILKELRNEEA